MPSPFRVPEIPEPARQAPMPVRLDPPMVFVPPRWEYKHLIRKVTDEAPLAEAELNALGREGWELVAVYPGSGAVHFYFKRLGR